MDEHSTSGLGQEAISFGGQSCLMVYKEMGLTAAVTYLFAFLRQYYPITRIVCGFRHFYETLFIPVADTLPGGPKTTHSLRARGYTKEQIRKLLVRDDFTPFILNEDPFPGGPHGIFRQEDFISHLRIPMFVMGETTFQIGFCSDKPNVFHEEDMARFTMLTAPLGQCMSIEIEQTLKGEHSISTNHYQDSLSLLRLCDGLGPILEDIGRVAATDCTVLVGGETGVGKDMVASAIHSCSQRRTGPLIKINCAAVSESLLESELFGHEKGAFTGAVNARTGYFEAANGGTIFLDEIGELTPRMQGELLRTLDNHEIFRLGSSKGIPLDIRVIAATNRDLHDMVDEGSFRADLWYRINTFPIQVPPLRQRKMDIPMLTRLFVNTASSKLGLSAPPVISREQMEMLYRHDWPGNIRELRNVVERAMIRAKSGSSCLPLNFELITSRRKVEEHAVPAAVSTVATPSLPQAPEEKPWPSMAVWCAMYTEHILSKTGGRITGLGGAAAILGEHPNTVRARRDRLRKSEQKN